MNVRQRRRWSPGVTAVGTIVATAILVVGVIVAFAPGPVEIETPVAGPPGQMEAFPEEVPPVPERMPLPAGTFAQGRLPAGQWAVAARVESDGVCLEVEVTTRSSGEGTAACGLDAVTGIDLNTLGPTADGWLVVAGVAGPEVVRVVLEGDDVEGLEVELVVVDGHELRVFGTVLPPGEGHSEVAAYDESGEAIERAGLPVR